MYPVDIIWRKNESTGKNSGLRNTGGVCCVALAFLLAGCGSVKVLKPRTSTPAKPEVPQPPAASSSPAPTPEPSPTPEEFNEKGYGVPQSAPVRKQWTYPVSIDTLP